MWVIISNLGFFGERALVEVLSMQINQHIFSKSSENEGHLYVE